MLILEFYPTSGQHRQRQDTLDSLSKSPRRLARASDYLRGLLNTHCFRLHFFLLLELAHVQVIIEALLREQFIMLAALDDLTIFQYQDHIRIADGGETVRDDKGGATLQQFVECFLNETLGTRVHA